MLDYAHWPAWAQDIAAALAVLVVGTVYWFAWFRPAIRASARSTPVGWRTVLVVSAFVVVILILGWKWVNTH